MLDFILETAKQNERIRAVYMNGSRTNPNVETDEYQDYDIVFVVTDTEWFIKNNAWINAFGEVAIVQEPDKNDVAFSGEHDFTKSYTWLILLKNNKRIDLCIETMESMFECYGEDKLTVPLLDKDGILRPLPPPSDIDYYVMKPSESQFLSCCNNFWWCLNNVGKGIKRDQLPYVMWMYNVVVRDELNKMIDWYIGLHNDFHVNVGMAGKYYKKYLPENLYKMLADTYSDSDYKNLWNSIEKACDLFHVIALGVAKNLVFKYIQNEEDAIRNYFNCIKNI